MAWPTPKFSRSQVSKAGEYLTRNAVPGEDLDSFERWLGAYEVLANWRACHGYPINTFQATLRTRLKKIDPEALVAQRLKRTPSILSKLTRFKGMSLARMQDIGGLRISRAQNVYQASKRWVALRPIGALPKRRRVSGSESCSLATARLYER